MNGESDNPLDRAGTAILHAAKLQAQLAKRPEQPELNDAGYKALLAEARRSLEKADLGNDPHKFISVKTALEALEATERGESPLGGIELFKSLVESTHGGERDLDFGGRRRQGRKFSTKKQYLRAAAVALWEHLPETRDQLVIESRSLIGVESKAKLEKIVENYNNQHDVDIAKSGSALSIHMPLIRDLIKNYGYRTLKDFA
jgi:hypothetical protein